MYPSDIFYTQFATSYAQYAAQKQVYLSAVNNFIKQETVHFKTMVDVGSGDGKRSKEIANLLGVKHLTLIDSSEGMISLSKKIIGAEVFKYDISSTHFKAENKYDIVLCLWNVLGHISSDKREIAIKNLCSLVNKNGLIFLDINNRYNAAHYGHKAAFRNLFRDLFNRNTSNGDFDLSINAGKEKIHTKVHIFTPYEIEPLLKRAGMKISRKVYIDYRTGKTKSNFWNGQIVYKLSKI